MRVLHIFDHSIPLQSGYTFRSLAILREQRKLGIETWQITSSKQYGSKAAVEDILTRPVVEKTEDASAAQQEPAPEEPPGPGAPQLLHCLLAQHARPIRIIGIESCWPLVRPKSPNCMT